MVCTTVSTGAASGNSFPNANAVFAVASVDIVATGACEVCEVFAGGIEAWVTMAGKLVLPELEGAVGAGFCAVLAVRTEA